MWKQPSIQLSEQSQLEDFSAFLTDIAHFRLQVQVPVEEILYEIQTSINYFYRIHLNLKGRGIVGQDRLWYGRGLIDYLPDSKRLFEYRALPGGEVIRNHYGEIELHYTELSRQMPITMALVNSITNSPRITRFLRIPGGVLLPWHSHCQSEFIGFQPYHKVIVQIPLVTNSKVLYKVKRTKDEDQDAISLCYKAGEAWIFNSWHLHCVENYSKSPRTTLYIEIPLSDIKFQGLILNSLYLNNNELSL